MRMQNGSRSSHNQVKCFRLNYIPSDKRKGGSRVFFSPTLKIAAMYSKHLSVANIDNWIAYSSSPYQKKKINP